MEVFTIMSKLIKITTAIALTPVAMVAMTGADSAYHGNIEVEVPKTITPVPEPKPAPKPVPKPTQPKKEKDCPPKEQPKTPVYSCKLLTVTLGVDRAVNAKVDVVAENGATQESVSYDFGDGTAAVVTAGGPADHKYAKDGTYKVVATVSFNVGNNMKTEVKTSNCSVDVTIKLPETPKVLSETKVLPNTGVGSVAGLFAGATGLGTVGHFLVARRRG